jgi:signal transduction histidine kinase
MKIRTKTVIAISIVSLLLIIILYTISSKIVLQRFYSLEQESAQTNVDRALNALSREVEALAQSNRDWARWDDTYLYIANRNQEYIETNLNIESFEILRVNEVAYMDSSGNIVYAREFDHPTHTEKNISDEDLKVFTNLHEIKEESLSGLAYKDRELVLFSKKPILMSSLDSSPNGSLIFMRYFDESQIEELKQITRLNVSITLLEDHTSIKNVEQKETQDPLVEDGKIFTHALNEENTVGYAILKDYRGNPLVALTVTQPRKIMQQGKETITYLLVFIILIGAIFGVSAFILIEKLVISRIYLLNGEVKQIDSEKLAKKRTTERGKDEISELTRSINEMLDKIENSEKETKKISEDLEREKQNLKGKVVELEKTRTAVLNMMEDLKETNEHLKDLDKIKSNFLNIVSHELKTPLTAIFAYLDILKDTEKDLTEDQKKSFEAVKRNSDQLKGIINNILEISRIEAGKFELVITEINPIDKIQKIVQNLKPLAERKGVSLVHKSEKEFTNMETDEQRFEEIFNNLISNAVKFTEKGSITIKAKKQEKEALFSVADTGGGIPKEKIHELFQKFYQVDASLSRKFGGTGLGLSITKQLIELQGGRIWVESQVGKGTTFYFTLPLKPIKRGNNDKNTLR